MKCKSIFINVFAIFLNFCYASCNVDYILSKDALRQLDDWEIKVLRDFIRGKGRPIVERIPIDSLEESPNFGSSKAREDADLIDLFNPTMPQGGMEKSENAVRKNKEGREQLVSFPMSPPQPFTQIILPASRHKSVFKDTSNFVPVVLKTTTPIPTSPDSPSVEDYEQLTNVIQMFIDRRSLKGTQATLREKPIKKSTLKKIHLSAPNTSLPDQIITSSSDQQDTNSRRHVNKWSPMERFTPNVVEPPAAKKDKAQPKSKENYEKRMKELSAELTKILKQLEESKSEQQPQVHVLRNGSAEQTPDGQYIFIASITLVKDGFRTFLVDTGLGTNNQERNNLLLALQKHDLNFSSIETVVSTHGHPDHTGGVHYFPDAVHYQSWYSHHKEKFNLTALFESDTMNLSENVMLVKAKGHTSDDIAVIVRNAKSYGDVLISGDVFMREEDIDHPMMWQPLSADIVSQRESRRRYGCIVDWIVPGHGTMFRVNQSIKNSLKC